MVVYPRFLLAALLRVRQQLSLVEKLLTDKVVPALVSKADLFFLEDFKGASVVKTKYTKIRVNDNQKCKLV